VRRTPDPVSLVAGLAFTALGIALLLGHSLHLEARWAWPVLLIAVALALLPGVRPFRGESAPPPPSGAGGPSEGL
jgi:hypothetical protein